MPGTPAVLLAAYGGPDGPDEIRPFLESMAATGRLAPARLAELEAQYRGAKDLAYVGEATRRQAEGVRAGLAARGIGADVRVGTRHWRPSIAETVAGFAADGADRMAVLILAPHGEEASRAHYRRAIEAAVTGAGPGAPRPAYSPAWFDHPLFIEALAARVAEAVAGSPLLADQDTPWIFTAHSVPAGGGGDGYREEFRRTGELLADRLGHGWIPAYQSAPPSGGAAWLGPDISGVLRDCAGKGARAALAVPIGFLADHKEVAHDLRVAAAAAGREAGLELSVARTVDTHPAFIEMLSGLARVALESRR